jgi:hypothetical protein
VPGDVGGAHIYACPKHVVEIGGFQSIYYTYSTVYPAQCTTIEPIILVILIFLQVKNKPLLDLQ